MSKVHNITTKEHVAEMLNKHPFSMPKIWDIIFVSQLNFYIEAFKINAPFQDQQQIIELDSLFLSSDFDEHLQPLRTILFKEHAVYKQLIDILENITSLANHLTLSNIKVQDIKVKNLLFENFNVFGIPYDKSFKDIAGRTFINQDTPLIIDFDEQFYTINSPVKGLFANKIVRLEKKKLQHILNINSIQ